MKPRLFLKGRYMDNGYSYERWWCAGRYRVGYGPTPESAYDDWARQTNVDKREGI